MNITEQEIQTLQNSQTEHDWNAACDAIKKARNGQYPPDWFMRVMMGGIMQAAERRFGRR